MTVKRLKAVTLFLILCSLFFGFATVAAAASPDLLKAKKESEAKGLIFVTSHDEIVAQAKKEGKMRSSSSMEYASIKAMEAAFKKAYPFLDVEATESTGTDANRRFLLEVKAGRPVALDASHISTDMYTEYIPLMKKFDILGMARHGVLNIPPEVVDQANPFILAATCNMQVSAYHKQLMKDWNLPIPQTWEDFLKPEYKNKKFVVDIRPTEVAALVPAWGIEKVLDFARKIKDQNPVWARGGTRTLTAMAVGEYGLFMGPNYHTVARAMEKDPTNSLGMIVMEPIPVRPTESVGILGTSEHPYAGLLWMEFLTGPAGQKIVDEHEPYGASVFFSGGAVNKATQGKQLSLATWETQQKMPEYQRKIVEAYGFPRAEIKRKRK